MQEKNGQSYLKKQFKKSRGSQYKSIEKDRKLRKLGSIGSLFSPCSIKSKNYSQKSKTSIKLIKNYTNQSKKLQKKKLKGYNDVPQFKSQLRKKCLQGYGNNLHNYRTLNQQRSQFRPFNSFLAKHGSPQRVGKFNHYNKSYLNDMYR